MRANAAQENGVAVVEQMVSGDRRTQKAARFGHVLSGLFCRDVLKDNFQLGKITPQRLQLGFDENGFAVKQVNLR